MLISEVNHTDSKIVRVLPTLRVRVFLEPLHATFDKGAVRAFERPEFVEHIRQAEGFDAFAVGRLLRVEKGIHAVGRNGDVLVISDV
jgi:hypothetical protein